MSIKTTNELEKWAHVLAKRINGAVVGTSETQYGALVLYVICSGAIYRVALANEYGDTLVINIVDKIEFDV